MIDFAKELKKESFDEKIKYIKVLQTHISWVFLTGKYAYKIKKPVNFGFLDFSTLRKRKKFCERELEVNKRFSPDMYLDVLPITKNKNCFKINGSGKIIEYCIKMKEIPQKYLMDKLLEKGKINKDVIDKIAKIVSDVYSRERSNEKMRKIGSKNIKYNFDENFEQTKQFVGGLISKNAYDTIRKMVYNFMEKNKGVFKKRVKNIILCHGDLHSGNIFVYKRIYIFDAIEFNDRFIYLDPAADVAFLAMDLEFKKRKYLADFFVKKYVEYSDDKGILDVIDFYKCYRAYVRAKVNALKSKDPRIKISEKLESEKIAKKYFYLSLKYAKSFS
jgi:aminoglycoside phosphotransferase family enzyme